MRSHLACLMLLMPLVVLPLMNLMAAPAPAPSAILDIGPPPKGQTAEEYCKRQIDLLNYYDSLFYIAYNVDPEFRKLPAVDRVKDVRFWLATNLRVKEDDKWRRLRLTFRSGSRAEQATIINGMLRADLHAKEDRIKHFESCIRSYEKSIFELEFDSKLERNRDSVDSYRKGINDLRSKRIPACRAEIARLKQFTVIKWAK